MHRALSLTALLTLAACGNDATLTGKVIVEYEDDTGGGGDDGGEVEDADADGYTVEDGDCDDTDPSINPGAGETWYDGVDADCAGDSDYDADQDGHNREPEGGDCDDTDAAVNPDATEVWYDGVDADCAGDSDYDADQDGFDSDVHGGDDCDDTDASINVWSIDTWYDGVDSNCLGDSDYDADGDGHDHDAYGGDDCDDTEPTTYTGASDTWYDGVDSDCGGDSDYDADADGYDSDAYSGTDCDDTVATTYPGASDTWYDGVDADCAGNSDYDGDGDGHDSDAYSGGTDCDDTTSSVSPGVSEVTGNGIDDDCDPSTPAFSGTLDLSDSTATWSSTLSGWGVGVAILDDVDSDGTDAEIAIGARYARPNGATRNDGAVYTFAGLDTGGTEADAMSETLHTGLGGELGVRVRAMDDLDGDGIGEVFLSAYSMWTDWGTSSEVAGAGAWYVVSGADLTTDFDLSNTSNALAWGTGVETTQYFGFEGGNGDFDGDGVQDLFVASAASTRSTSNEIVLFLSTSGAVPTGEQVIGASNSIGLEGDDADGRDRYGWHTVADDVDADGIDDLIVGAYEQNTCGADDAGAVFVHLGPITTATTYASADSTLCSATVSANANLGRHVGSGDMDDDGYPDVTGGAHVEDSSMAGHVPLWAGGASGVSSTPAATFTAGEVGDWFGNDLHLAGDLSGDGVSDLVVAARNAAISGSSDVGKVYIYEGGASYDTTADVTVEVDGTSGDYVLLDVGDIDLDGVDDLIANNSVWLFGTHGWQE